MNVELNTEAKDEVVIVKNPDEMKLLISSGMLYIRKLETIVNKINYPVTVKLAVVDDQFVMVGLFGTPTINSVDEFMNKYQVKV